jgi:hypothetical protein
MVGAHEIKVYDVVKAAQRWLPTRQIAQRAGVSLRATHNHLTNFVRLEVFEQARLADGFHYRHKETVVSPEGRKHVAEIEAAREVLASDYVVDLRHGH